MNTTRKFWFVLAGAILGMAIIACSCGSFLPTPTSAPLPPTSVPLPPPQVPTATPPPATLPPATQPPAPVNPLPGLAGNWQEGPKVFTIAWQDGKYVVTGLKSVGAGTRTLTTQSWDGSHLTWTFTYSDENGDSTITYKTATLKGDTLTIDYSSDSGPSSRLHTLIRVASSNPDYYPLPYSDDFSNPDSGWDIFSSDTDSASYGNGTYTIISKTNKYTSYGGANRFFGDTVIAVDATPFTGPTDNNFSYNVGCRNETNADGYIFEIEADGYYAVGYYTGGGKTYHSLMAGSNEWVASSAIHQGMVTNHLVVTCAGDKLKLQVNGQVVFQGQDSTFTEGDISLGAGTYDANNTSTEVKFDNLAVTAP